MPTQKPKHNMLDLETYGTAPGCVVLSIGSVFFDAGGLKDEFHKVISVEDSMLHGLWADNDTIAWWKKQSTEAKKLLDLVHAPDATKLEEAINEFAAWYGGINKSALLWGCGADFDKPIIEAAFNAVKVKTPWRTYNGRCYRTAKNLVGAPSMGNRGGVYHSALDDAKNQALHLIAIDDKMGGILLA